MVDVQYFDGRISIILWILLSGSRNILEEEKNILLDKLIKLIFIQFDL